MSHLHLVPPSTTLPVGLHVNDTGENTRDENGRLKIHRCASCGIKQDGRHICSSCFWDEQTELDMTSNEYLAFRMLLTCAEADLSPQDAEDRVIDARHEFGYAHKEITALIDLIYWTDIGLGVSPSEAVVGLEFLKRELHQEGL